MIGGESLKPGLPRVNLEGLGTFLYASWPPGIASFTHSLTHKHLLPSRPWRQHRSDVLSVLIYGKLSLPLRSLQAWPLHDPALELPPRSSGDVFAESGQSQPRQTLPSLCLSTPLCPPSIAIHTLGPGSKWLCLHESRIGFVLLHSIVIKLEKKSSKALPLPFEKHKAREANNSHSPHPAHQHILSALLLKINSESDCCSPTSLALSWLSHHRISPG